MVAISTILDPYNIYFKGIEMVFINPDNGQVEMNLVDDKGNT